MVFVTVTTDNTQADLGANGSAHGQHLAQEQRYGAKRLADHQHFVCLSCGEVAEFSSYSDHWDKHSLLGRHPIPPRLAQGDCR